MYIAYVDESGDPGRNTRLTTYFTLSGIILVDSNWKIFLEKVKAFRQGLKRDFGLPLRADLRASDWTMFFQRYENWLMGKQELGIVVNDEGYDKMVRLLSRKMRVYNPIPSHYGGYYKAPVVKIIEDPFSRHSQYSYFVQLADMSAYLARLRHDHTPSQTKWGIHKLYKRIKPRYMLEASRKDNYGFVIYP